MTDFIKLFAEYIGDELDPMDVPDNELLEAATDFIQDHPDCPMDVAELMAAYQRS